ncbi:MAG: hypothetical protein O3A87_12275, partial [Verrucomicrobia bacterium]|nr:hypothetical protein [Verrucomicrobiota bacterium]
MPTKVAGQGVVVSMGMRRVLARDALLLVPMLIVVAAMCAVPAVVDREVLDSFGKPVLDELGEVVWEEDRWETWKLNWESNL